MLHRVQVQGTNLSLEYSLDKSRKVVYANGTMLTVGSLFSGIGGLDEGLRQAGMICKWQVEIDKRCNQVLRRHWSDTERFGDVKECGKHNLAPVDIVVGGFPCQDISIAGKRKGLAGERSGLWFEFHRILKELRPRWAIIENVPGLLSSNGGRDFAIILQGLAQIGFRTAWRILDAQFDGVAQRRRRVFIVSSLGNGSCTEVLFESESLSWDTAPHRETGKELASDVAASIRSGGTGKRGWIGDAEHGLVAAPVKASSPSRRGGGSSPTPREFVIAQTITSREGQRRDPLTETYIIKGAAIGRKPSAGPQYGEVLQDGSTYTLNATEVHAVAYTIQANDGGEHKRKDRPQGGMYVKETEQALTLGSSDRTVVAFEPGNLWRRCGASPSTELVSTLGAEKQGDTFPHLAGQFGVRRLTPTECERLQGFSDGHTAWGIDSDGKRVEMSDSARYRMLGNAVCVPVAKWIGQQIIRADSLA